MPDLTYPAGFPLTSGATLDPDLLGRLFYDDTGDFSKSLAILNGGLDLDNLSPTWAVDAEHTQRGSHVEMLSTGRTANLDWRWSWVGQYESDFPFVFTEETPYKPIPGGAVEFYCKYDAYVLLLWQAFWMNDNAVVADLETVFRMSEVFLLVDGEHQAAQWRATNIVGSTVASPQGYEKARCWSGHVLLALDEGWHSAALCHVADRRIRNTRHWASNMKAMISRSFPAGP